MPKDSATLPKNQELSLHEKGLIAFQRAIDKVILEHQRLNLPLWIKRNGKLEAVSADEILEEKRSIK
jgi:hypothetical protein